jgi:hypothetical protein
VEKREKKAGYKFRAGLDIRTRKLYKGQVGCIVIVER